MRGRGWVVFLLLFCAFAPFSYAGGDTLTVAWPVNVGPLNPHLYHPNQMFAQVMVYDPLVRYNGKDVEGALAESWTVSSDGKTYTFKLKKKIQFSDGTPFDSAAVAMNFEAIMANAARHQWIALVSMIDGWETPDSGTFVLHLKHPYHMALLELSLPRPFRMLSPSGFLEGGLNTGKGIKKAVGTGPWVLSGTKPGEYDIFVRNEHYWGKRPAYDAVKVLVLPDPNSRVIALETDRVDILIGEGSFTVENFARLSKNPRYEAFKSSPRATNMVAIHSGRSAVREQAVRRAILHAVNKEALIRYILLDQEEMAHQLYNPSLPYCGAPLAPFEYNPEKAAALLDEAGWKKDGIYRKKGDTLLALDFHYTGTDPKQKAIAEAIQADLMKVGFKINLRGEESTIFANLQANGNFDLIFNQTWGPPFEPGSFTASMRTPSHADYQAQSGLPQKEAIDRAISELIISTSEKEIAGKYRYVLATLHEEAVYLPFSYEQDRALFKKGRIANFRFGEMTPEFLFHEMEPGK